MLGILVCKQNNLQISWSLNVHIIIMVIIITIILSINYDSWIITTHNGGCVSRSIGLCYKTGLWLIWSIYCAISTSWLLIRHFRGAGITSCSLSKMLCCVVAHEHIRTQTKTCSLHWDNKLHYISSLLTIKYSFPLFSLSNYVVSCKLFQSDSLL